MNSDTMRQVELLAAKFVNDRVKEFDLNASDTVNITWEHGHVPVIVYDREGTGSTSVDVPVLDVNGELLDEEIIRSAARQQAEIAVTIILHQYRVLVMEQVMGHKVEQEDNANQPE